MENRSHALMTGFFTIALLVAAVLAGIWFNRDRVVRVPYLLATTLSVPGLNPQAAVRYRGLEVGKVDDIGFDPTVPGQILVHISVNPDTPITKSTFATLGYQGVTGIAYVQLDDQAVAAALMPSDAEHLARIPLRPGLLDELEKRGKLILDQTEQLTAKANELLSPANQKSMLAAFDNISKTASAFGALAHQLEPAVAKLPELTGQAQQSLAAFKVFSDDADKLAKNWNGLATDLRAPDGAIGKISGTVDRIGGSVEGVVGGIELDALPHVIALTDETRSSMRAVKRAMNTLNERPQSLLFGGPGTPPGPGEAGFAAPTK
jgi:phospholipid/cholesterol/gamma-HCH transport system substrate-binding protein